MNKCVAQNELTVRSCCLYDENTRVDFKGETYQFDSDGFKIWHYVASENFDGDVVLPIVENYIFMCFSLRQRANLSWDNGKDFSFNKSEQNIFYLPNSKNSVFSVEKGKDTELFIVLLEADVFFNYFPINNTELFMRFKQKVAQKEEPIGMTDFNFPVHLEMKRVINSMIYSERRDECKHLYFKAKIIELLSIQLEQVISNNSQVKSDTKKLKKEEFKRVEHIKMLLERSPEDSYTLLGLARLVGTNDATLKKHFKMAFDTTVFNYLNRCRMEKAHSILETHEFKVAHVAEEVGFKYASHFSASFKKHYGYSPAELKNANKAAV